MTRKHDKGESRFDTLASLKAQRAGSEAKSEPATAAPRTTGRRSDPDYMQTTVFLPKSMHKELKVALAEEEREFSALAESLFAEWLAKRKKTGK